MSLAWVIAYLVQWLLTILTLLLVLGILRMIAKGSVTQLSTKPQLEATYKVGEVVQPLPVLTLDGIETSLTPELEGRRQTVLFASTGCPACRQLIDKAVKLKSANQPSSHPLVVVLEIGKNEDALNNPTALSLSRVGVRVFLVDKPFGLFSAGFSSVPQGVVVNEDLVIESSTIAPHQGQWLNEALASVTRHK